MAATPPVAPPRPAPAAASLSGLDPTAQEQWATLCDTHPAAAACLSARGRRLYYPRGVTAQAAEAAGCPLNATVGQITDGHGHAVPLPAIREARGPLSAEELVLYAPQGGVRALRSAWQARLAARGGPVSLPVVTCGITHGLATVSDLFGGPDRTVLLPAPAWGNYAHIFGRHGGARLQSWKLIEGAGLDLGALRAAVQGLTGPATVLLNFPSNPVGYSPRPDEREAIVEIIAAAPHPIVAVSDDAYLGMVWEPPERAASESLFHALSGLDPARVLAVKLDGATKELFFFGGRVGFISFGATGPAAAALEDKAIGAGRATVSSAPAGSQALVLRALRDPDMPAHQEALRETIRARYRALRDGLAAAGVSTFPFNSAFFALVPVPGDPERARRTLLAAGVGVVAVPQAQAIRVSYASVALDDIPQLVAAIATVARP